MASSIPLHSRRAAGKRNPVTAVLRGMAAWSVAALRSYRERRALAAMSDALLKDLGLTRGDIERAIGGPLGGAIDYRELERIREVGRGRARP
jgi:uncharacterized protein YjiS (DUF1127 family)